MEGKTSGRWLRLNADGLFIACLALFSGIFDLLEPDVEDLAAQIGDEPITYYVWSALYLVGGLVMLVGFLRQWMAWELMGRYLIILGAVMEMIRVGLAFGFFSSVTIDNYVVVALLVFFFTLRTKVLLSKDGTVVIVGGEELKSGDE